MYVVKFDNNNGVILTKDKSNSSFTPTPVYIDELNFLGFNKYFSYNNTSEPLLWKFKNKYYYNGVLVAKLKGGDVLNKPVIEFTKQTRLDMDIFKFEPIPVKDVISKNKKQLHKLQQDALQFIKSINYKYPKAVSFSGGKDSQAVLNLVYQGLKDNFTVIYSDTTLESPDTYKVIKETIKHYPGINIHIAKPDKNALELIKLFGLPSRYIRWCTPILKTNPFNKLINKLLGNNDKIVVFEGVRRDESNKRKTYKNIADGVVHDNIINVRPILDWNSTEVILYNLWKDLPLNNVYKRGLNRTGCVICPFNTKLNECYHNYTTPDWNNNYYPLIKEYADNRGNSEFVQVNKLWKHRSGGKYVSCDTFLWFKKDGNKFICVAINPENDIKDYDLIKDYELIKDDNKLTFIFKDVTYKRRLELKRLFKKFAYCVNCGYCDYNDDAPGGCWRSHSLHISKKDLKDII